ncbi:ubiquitin fusion degradation protein UFD1AP [Toxoplasma gondii ME49]|uniref:Ubiquitin fusion degradation protein UFD1AP n=1 Tax=Toxoplasma gondii (strain ATCC 50611 / Me49) TaxID=508771 RepID=S8F8L1_TOXGM|nr:ubiquitin fusion degradation protein UFD1AP [Toxoplasma gondii ME49]EPT31087.1 ubiquitin fusion degradation protein UFD1AP [Toxoplasma gondii ME49]|eukprot:XP_018637810.1 ubiquitin fusion degradation protein UFD1AP [Toxoplasma gondii ME49]
METATPTLGLAAAAGARHGSTGRGGSLMRRKGYFGCEDSPPFSSPVSSLASSPPRPRQKVFLSSRSCLFRLAVVVPCLLSAFSWLCFSAFYSRTPASFPLDRSAFSGSQPTGERPHFPVFSHSLSPQFVLSAFALTVELSPRTRESFLGSSSSHPSFAHVSSPSSTQGDFAKAKTLPFFHCNSTRTPSASLLLSPFLALSPSSHFSSFFPFAFSSSSSASAPKPEEASPNRWETERSRFLPLRMQSDRLRKCRKSPAALVAAELPRTSGRKSSSRIGRERREAEMLTRPLHALAALTKKGESRGMAEAEEDRTGSVQTRRKCRRCPPLPRGPGEILCNAFLCGCQDAKVERMAKNGLGAEGAGHDEDGENHSPDAPQAADRRTEHAGDEGEAKEEGEEEIRADEGGKEVQAEEGGEKEGGDGEGEKEGEEGRDGIHLRKRRRRLSTWISDVLRRARLEQRVEDLNILFRQQGSTDRVYLVLPLSEALNPPADHFSHNHIMEGDKAILPREVLPLLLERQWDAPWHFLLEKVFDLCDSEALATTPPRFAAGRLPQALPGGDKAANAECEGEKKARQRTSPRRVSVSVLDFSAPRNFIFLPLWVMKALDLRPFSIVACKWERLPLAGHVTLQPTSSAFVRAVQATGRDIQKVLEQEIRHYSSLTANSVIPVKIQGQTFRLHVRQIQAEGNAATGEDADHVCVQDSDVATTLLPAKDEERTETEPSAVAQGRLTGEQEKQREKKRTEDTKHA